MSRRERIRKPWEKRDDESRQAYDAFVAYLTMDPSERTIVAAARLHKGKPELANIPGSWARWSADYDWVARVSAYDAEASRELAERLLSRRVEMKAKRVKLLEGLHDFASEQVRKILTSNPDAIKVNNVSELNQLIKTVTEGLRAEFGDEPIQRHAVIHASAEDIQRRIDEGDMTQEEVIESYDRLVLGIGEDEADQ